MNTEKVVAFPQGLSRTSGSELFSHVAALPIPLQTTVIGALGAVLDIVFSEAGSHRTCLKMLGVAI